MTDKIKVFGSVAVWKNGELCCESSNIVVTAGFELYASIIGASGTKPSHMAFGDSTVPTTLSMTALQGTEAQRKALDSTTVTGADVKYQATFGSGLVGTKTMNEIGIFNSASAGTMLARFLTQTISITSSDTVVVVWTVTIGG